MNAVEKIARQWLEGLKDLLPITKSHSLTTTRKAVELIFHLGLEISTWSGVRLGNYLKLPGISVNHRRSKLF